MLDSSLFDFKAKIIYHFASLKVWPINKESELRIAR